MKILVMSDSFKGTLSSNQVNDTLVTLTIPMCGVTGSAYTFALQKGASKEQLPILDKGLKHLLKTASQKIGAKEEDFLGAGAAGGLVWHVFPF